MTACASKFNLLRRFGRCGTVVILSALYCLASDAGAADKSPSPSREAAATLVIYNIRDPESKSLAEYYAQKRSIPDSQVVGLDCTTDETIARQDYIDTIEAPLRRMFESESWWEIRADTLGRREVTNARIRFVALMRGMPLKIRTVIPPAEPDKPPPPRPNAGDPVRSHDEASVDSELAALSILDKDTFGIVFNPYYRRFTPILDAASTVGVLLVCRLDAPTAATVRRMIDDGIEAERNGLYGWAYIDRRSTPDGGYKEGDTWLLSAAAECWNKGIPVILDNMPAIFPAGFPITDAALYYGWYEGAISGAMASPAPRFQRGAVAVHIHSFSASTLRNPAAFWVAPLITAGAAASLGNVYEPYLDLTAHLDVFNERLLQSFTLAESAYMSQKALSWMNVVIGDPLYRPFATSQNPLRSRQPDKDATPWAALGVPLRKAVGGGLAQILYLKKMARETPSGLNYEALGMLQSFNEEPLDALDSLEKSGSLYKDSAETFRTVIERLRILQSIGNKTEALKLISDTLRQPQPPDRTKLLGDIKNEISPPPPPPPTPGKKP